MGNRISVQQEEHSKSTKVKSKAFAKELRKKLYERNILFIGEAQCGKTHIIKTIVDIYATNIYLANTNALNSYKYNLNASFVVNEKTDPSLVQKHGYSGYKYFNLINQIRKPKELLFMEKDTIKKVLNSQIADYKNNLNYLQNNVIDYELLVNAYIRSLTHIRRLPTDIINLLILFSSKAIITSHKIKYIYNESADYEPFEGWNDIHNNTDIAQNIHNLWEISNINNEYSYYTQLLFDSIHALIFVLDISQYDEFDCEGNNKLMTAFNAFKSFYNNPKNNNILHERWLNPLLITLPNHNIRNKQCGKISAYVIFSKMDIFKHKLINQKISINKCPLFNDYNYIYYKHAYESEFKQHYKHEYESLDCDYESMTLYFIKHKLKSELRINSITKTDINWPTYIWNGTNDIFKDILSDQRCKNSFSSNIDYKMFTV